MKVRNILLISDDDEFSKEISAFLKKNHFSIHHTDSTTIHTNPGNIDLIMIDSEQHRYDEHLISQITSNFAKIPFIVIADAKNTYNVVNFMKMGAIDFIQKPTNSREIHQLAGRILSLSTLSIQIQSSHRLYQELLGTYESRMRFSFVSANPEMMKLMDMIAKIASEDNTNVMIVGENGVGKETIAQNIHSLSNRRNQPFVRFECTKFLPAQIESELFGTTYNVFTKQDDDKDGYLSLAQNGLLFIEDFTEIPLHAQQSLLESITSLRFRKLGSRQYQAMNVRFIVTSKISSDVLKKDENHSCELVELLSNHEIELKPLRDRKEDILLLAKYFIQIYSEINQRSQPELSSDVQQLLLSYSYPGNINELKSMIRKAMVLSDHDAGVLYREDFPDLYIEKRKHDLETDWQEGFRPLDILDETEKQWIINALEFYQHNKTHVANALHITRQSLNRRILKHHIKDK
ncbi:MAG TPA: sigma 54-interacting transcriptional regulator [Candidatus Cloacimonadota bacterium]|nr:sigma 54-interacting transcriptional regulator [Candidatus Cloacimonadota bacterium]HPT73021.1 sigma 54-interacting transcriptional regulator [Candidatus Cloacimonadota bacterium]